MNKEIKIYTTETCPYCKEVKQALEKHDIVFDNLLISENQNEWRAIIALTGMPTVPTIVINNEHMVPGRDFANAENLINIIKAHKPSSFPKEIILFEKLKSLNYNMSLAFNRTNQILTQIETKIK
jgi:glutaredoxin 3